MQDNTTDHTDHRLDPVETLHIDVETFKKALKRNYLEPPAKWSDRNFVLRLSPPFEAEMDADYYESMMGRRYDRNWDEKPIHLKPELVIIEGTDRGFRGLPEWPTETSVKNALAAETIEEDGGLEAAVEASRAVFWEELEHDLPETVDLAKLTAAPLGTHTVDIEWHDTEDDQ